MRPDFADVQILQQAAEVKLTEGLLRLKNWWVNKYKLPANHPLFIGSSVGELYSDFIEDILCQRESLLSVINGPETPQQIGELYNQLNAFNEVLGYKKQAYDPLVEQWEKELEAGLMPDLDQQLEDLDLE